MLQLILIAMLFLGGGRCRAAGFAKPRDAMAVADSGDSAIFATFPYKDLKNKTSINPVEVFDTPAGGSPERLACIDVSTV